MEGSHSLRPLFWSTGDSTRVDREAAAGGRLQVPSSSHRKGSMPSDTPSQGTRFGRTLLVAGAGEVIDQPVQAVVYAANQRGVMGAGPAGSIRSAGGAEVEREAMAHAPIDLGTAVLTGSGHLEERGITAVIHASVTPSLGESAKLGTIERAVTATLRAA